MSAENYHSIASLDKRIDELSKNLTSLDTKVEKQGKKRIAAAAGVIGFVISSIIGVFTIYEKVVAEPERMELAESEAVRKRLDELLQTSITIQQATLTNPIGAQVTIGMLASKRSALIQRAVSDFAGRPTDFLVSDLFVLVNELITIGRPEAALPIADAALARATGPIEQANAKLMTARVLSAPSPIRDVGRARDLQSAALDQARSTVSLNALDTQVSALEEMLALELFERNCRGAEDVVEATKRQLRAANPTPQYRSAVRSMMEEMVLAYGSPCTLDFSGI